jgi:acyl carrier protein
MTSETETKLREIVRSVLHLSASDDVSRASQLTIPAWDSLAHVSLMLALESEFDVTIDIADQLDLTSFGAIHLYLDENDRG